MMVVFMIIAAVPRYADGLENFLKIFLDTACGMLV